MEHFMSLVTKPAPDFETAAVDEHNTIIEDFSLSSLRGRYVILLFYPLNFTFVCPSEILAFDKARGCFLKRDAEIVALSVDSVYSHLAWKRTSTENGGIGSVRITLASDIHKSIARSYGVLHESGVALRGLFLLDREGIVRHEVVNDLSLGRNVEEASRMLDALRFYETKGEVCPANWQEGQEGMRPTQDGVVDYLSQFMSVK
jgi:peroxiredoxin (alkyl hydroperoxide reductase subunit C)